MAGLFNNFTVNCDKRLSFDTFQNSLSFSKVCGCGVHNGSPGDQELLAFLKEELQYEKDSMQGLPKPKLDEFNKVDDMNTTSFKISRKINGERIVVSFDIDESMNKEEFDDEDSTIDGNVTSYPSFSIQIIKDSNATLHFNCEYNPEDSIESKDEHGVHLFTIIDVCLLPHPDADHSNVYHCETENMDYNMYELLMGMLSERGIDNEFLTDLLKKSTLLEHEHYLKFLQSLQDFLVQK